MNFQLKLAWRYLWGRKTRAILTTLAVSLGVMLIFGFSALVPVIADLVKQDIEDSQVEFDILISRDGLAFFSRDILEEVAAVPGAIHVIGTLERDLVLPESEQFTTAEGHTITALEIKAGEQLDPNPYQALVKALGDELAAGRSMTPADNDQPYAIISTHMAEAKGVGVGDTLMLPSVQGQLALEVIGLHTGDRSGIAEEQVYLTLSAGQALFNVPGQLDHIVGLVDPAYDLLTVQEDVRAILPAGYNFGSLSAGGSAFDSAMQMADAIFGMIGFLALAMAGLVMFNTFRTAVLERKRDIGMLRAIGATRRTVMTTFLMEGAILGVLGTIVGLIIGYAFAWAVIPFMEGYIKDFFGDTQLGSPVFSLGSLITALLLGIGIPVLSGLWPARIAGKMTPMEALRPVSPDEELKQSRRSTIIGVVLAAAAVLGLLSGDVGLSALGMMLFFISILLVSPLLIRPVARIFGRLLVLLFAREGHVATENLNRQPNRAAITASTLAIGMAIIVALSGLVSSALDGVGSYLDQTLDADYLVLSDALFMGTDDLGADPALAESIAAVEGVERVTTIRRGPITHDTYGTMNILGIDPVGYPTVTGLYFTAGDESAFDQLNEGRTAIVNSFLAQGEKLGPGDTITLTTMHGPEDYTIVAAAADYLNVKQLAVYISQDNLAADFNLQNDVVVMADIVPGADELAVETAMLPLVQPYSQFSLHSFESLKASQMESMESAKVIYSFLMAILAIPSLLALINTLTISVLERTREIGVLRAIGSIRRQVRRMIMAESLLLAALGIAIGILVGIWMSWVFVNALSFIGLPVPYFFPYMGIWVAIAVGLIFGVIAALAPARRATRLNIIEALAYE